MVWCLVTWLPLLLKQASRQDDTCLCLHPLTLFVNPSPPCSLGFAPYSLMMVASSRPKPMASKPQSLFLSLPRPLPSPPAWGSLDLPSSLEHSPPSPSLPTARLSFLIPLVAASPRGPLRSEAPLSIFGLPGMASPTPWAYQATSTPSPAQTWPLSSRSDSKSPWGPPHPPHSWAPSFLCPHPHLMNLLHGPL